MMPGPLITLPLSVLVAWLGVRALVITARQWTGRRPRRPISDSMRVRTWPRVKYLDAEDRRAYDRGGLAFAAMLIFFAVFIEAVPIAGLRLGQGPGIAEAFDVVAGLSFLAFMISICLFLSIKYFNRPRMLVPPPMRGEPGVIAGRRRRREGG